MRNIEVKILTPIERVIEIEDMTVCAARLTQRGHTIHNMEDFMDLYYKGYDSNTLSNLTSLPHPTLQKFGVINAVVVGGSRRFLAQITRHQNEVKFMSASLQYSDYSDAANFVVPYELLRDGLQEKYYLDRCCEIMKVYKVINACVDNDTAGYIMPQSLRNVLIISATPYQWKHMISQRVCRRNTDETRYIMLRLWEQLYSCSKELFGDCGPFCMRDGCKEGKMSCGNALSSNMTPTDIIKADFPLLCEGGNNEG